MRVGDRAEITRRFDAGDLSEYAGLGGHVPGGQRVPGILINALWSYLLGMELPGLGTNYLKQQTRWLTPAQPGRALTARVEITRLRPEKYLVDLATTCRDEDGRLVAEGSALVYVRDVAVRAEADD
jgi:acyl dehydratase